MKDEQKKPGKGYKWLSVAGETYLLDLYDIDLPTVIERVKGSLKTGEIVEIPVLDEKNRRMTLYLNGKRIGVVKFDFDLGPRPSEVGP